MAASAVQSIDTSGARARPPAPGMDGAPPGEAPDTAPARAKPLRQFLRTVTPTGRARPFERSEIIVSKTDPKGIITYANDVFLRVAQMEEETALGAPHSIVRHPDMPRCVFKLLWDRVSAGEEIFAYVLNLASSGDHYWVLAHVTPSWGPDGKIVGYHSSRRAPRDNAVEVAAGLYRQLKAVEDAAGGKADGMARGAAALGDFLKEKGLSYDELVFSL
ncbi:PAS domain-containing protein [Rhodovulum sp. DZ06]|uniref:PAS domain-containing protein n=1 Tax=Rhodovulum sp. DZ06 TaxID=3425126 RepID=UPI003D336941